MTTPTPQSDPGEPVSSDSPDARGNLAGFHPPEDSIDAELADDQKVERIANLVFAQVENKLEQHLHTQMELPPADQAAQLRDKAPEVYNAWIEIARQKADTEAFVQRAQYDVPASLARTGRPWALVALVVVFVFCGYIASLGGPGIYVAGIIGAIDLVTMLGLFMGARPELEGSRGRAKQDRAQNQGEKQEQQPPDESADPH